MPSDTRKGAEDGQSSAPRPLTLKPPATIISPPSPIDPSPTSRFPTPPRQTDSPESTSSSDESFTSKPRRPRGPSHHLGPLPLAADSFVPSPAASPSALSPQRTRSHPTSPRSASPTSPYFRPKDHRRESSTHRVRETVDGEQRSTEDGQRMINQYKIGKALGKGAYATVESGVDIGTGIEYVNSRGGVCWR